MILDNTAYYGDFASTSNVNQIRFASATPQFYSTTSTAVFDHDSNSTPVAFALRKSGSSLAEGSNYGVLNLQRTNHTNGTTNVGASLFFELKDDGGTLREYAGITGRKTVAGASGGQLDFHNYGRNVIGYANADQIYHSSSVRSPIFYDSNNTSYYVDPNNTTVSAVFARTYCFCRRSSVCNL